MLMYWLKYLFGENMPLFDPLVASSLFVLASTDPICQMPKPTEINVKPSTQSVQVITNKTLAEMQMQQIDTINPHSFGGISVTQGYAEGKIKMQAEIRLGTQTVYGGQAGCVWYDSVNINFTIDPFIYIAEEVNKDRCMRKAVLEHEMKHVNVDKKIVNKYAQQVGRKVYDGLKTRGFIAGPVRAEDIQATAERMKATISQIVDLEMKRLEIDRADMQAQVDTKEEYDRVGALCPDFKISKDMLGGGNAYSGRR